MKKQNDGGPGYTIPAVYGISGELDATITPVGRRVLASMAASMRRVLTLSCGIKVNMPFEADNEGIFFKLADTDAQRVRARQLVPYLVD